jgi:hypothetical protein
VRMTTGQVREERGDDGHSENMFGRRGREMVDSRPSTVIEKV